MTIAEMKTKFATLYNIMAGSKKVANMKLFGSVMSELMDVFIEEHPEQAEEYVNKLCAVKWNNYLTHDEAEMICAKMQPVAHWSYEEFTQAVEGVGGTIEHKPCYNSCALWVVMNMIYSDSITSITNIIGTNSDDQVNKAIYLLAVDKLCDEDGIFNVRAYFNV